MPGQYLVTVEATGVVRDADGNVKDTFPVRTQEVRTLTDEQVRELTTPTKENPS